MEGVDNGDVLRADPQAPALAELALPGTALAGPALPGHALPDSHILRFFESIGQDCEFSFVQRYAGNEPLGLFRFTTVSTAGLLKGLRDRFAEINETTAIEVFTETDEDPQANPDEWFAKIEAYEMLLHTNRLKSRSSEDEIRAEQRRRCRLLKRLFLEELQQPQKILVRAGDEDSPADMLEIMAELDEHGPNRLLWVSLADEAHASGSVERLAANFYRGYIERFWMPDGRIDEVLMDQWMSICRNTYKMVFENDPSARLAPLRARHNPNQLSPTQQRDSPDGRSFDLPFPGARMHVLRHATAYPNSVVEQILVDQELIRGAVYCFQLQVWIPEAFSGSSVSPYFSGLPSIKFLNANTALKNQWQPVWATAKMPVSDAVSVALSVEGNPGDVVLTRNWSLREGCHV